MNAAPAVRACRELMTGIAMGECPRWHEGRFWFSDWVGQTLYSVGEGGDARAEAQVRSLPFAVDWMPDGRMLLLNAAERKLLQREGDGSFAVKCDLAALCPHGTNEIVVDGRGNIYINDVNFDMSVGGPVKGYEDFQRTGERPGFIALVTPDWKVRKVADGLAFPNGMAITADNRTLIVAESYSGALTAFDIESDGSLSRRRLWAALEGGADGICLDAEGAVWAGSMQNAIRVREGGEVLEEVQVPSPLSCFAVMLGGTGGRTLLIVANAWTGDVPDGNAEPAGKLFTTRVDVPRAGFPGN
jgi:sugar lactone lactonase YvrE